ncbi:bromodomain-containing protein DDB_G0280777-like [Condylostylus longicornis]|uniref:bromodomain-containing protein DDB_G0280777-like n=1 Tax=Condylostylus longicornis TaxID=2530218 RepID=UPI00244DC738|nr:bromodomain-containing protein DDB_G0280777-like [Condylostylus longicornis]
MGTGTSKNEEITTFNNQPSEIQPIQPTITTNQEQTINITEQDTTLTSDTSSEDNNTTIIKEATMEFDIDKTIKIIPLFNEAKPENFVEFEKIFNKVFSNRKNQTTIHTELSTTIQANRPLNKYIERIEKMIAELNMVQLLELGEEHRATIVKLNDQLALGTFKTGLSEPLHSLIFAAQPKTFNEAVKIATEASTNNKTTTNNILYYKNNYYNKNNKNNNKYKNGLRYINIMDNREINLWVNENITTANTRRGRKELQANNVEGALLEDAIEVLYEGNYADFNPRSYYNKANNNTNNNNSKHNTNPINKGKQHETNFPTYSCVSLTQITNEAWLELRVDEQQIDKKMLIGGLRRPYSLSGIVPVGEKK